MENVPPYTYNYSTYENNERLFPKMMRRNTKQKGKFLFFYFVPFLFIYFLLIFFFFFLVFVVLMTYVYHILHRGFDTEALKNGHVFS
jgi:hypothetical protein